MSNRRALLIVAAAIIAIGVVVVFTLRRLAPADTSAAATAAPVASTPESAKTAKTAATPAPAEGGEETPPWLRPEAAASAAPATAKTPEQLLHEAQMQKLQASMSGLTKASLARSQETKKHLTEALDTLEQMNDPAVTSQVNLKAVRRNLDTSFRMQDLAQQLQVLAAQPASPQRQQQMDAIIAEIRKLQTQIVTDVRAPGSSLPAPQPMLPAH